MSALDHAGFRSRSEAACRAIEKAGGGAALAARLNLSRFVVQQWKTSGIPVGRLPAVSDATGIPAHELRPDLAHVFEAAAKALSQPQRQAAEPVTVPA